VRANAVGTAINTASATSPNTVDANTANNTSTVSTTIQPLNQPPVANPAQVTAEGATPTAITLTGTDPDGNPLTFQVVTGPAHGTLSGTAPNLMYTSSPGFTGADSFTFKVNDGQVDSPPATVSITVVDTTPPQLTPPPDRTVEATAPLSSVDLGQALAVDLVDGPVQALNDAPAAGFPLGLTEVTWRASDSHGNLATATQRITVVDTRPPLLTPPPDLTVEANAVLSSVNLGTATAIDLVDGPVQATHDAPPAGFPLGLTLVSWHASDSRGNTAMATQRVTVVDTTPPVVTPPPDVTVVATGTLTAVAIGTASAADIFPVTLSNNAPAAGFPLGTTLVSWTALDANGNSASATQKVNVVAGFGGFLPPVQEGSVYRLGRTLPVKFQALFANGTPITTLNATFVLQRLLAGEPAGEAIEATATNAPDSGNTFRLSSDQYIFNLDTGALSAGVYRMLVDLHDGSAPKAVQVGFK
jgi:hypothetical protein